MNRIDRLFGILIMLQSKKHVRAEDISEKFGISIRTVYRDLKAMSEQGIPISFEAHKGYGVVHGYFLPPVSFNTDEANALLLMETIIAGFADKSIQTHYSNALNKVKTVLRSHQKDGIEKLNEKMVMRLPDFVKNDFEYLSTIQQAISLNQLIRIEYTNLQSVSSNRLVEPIGLIFYAMTWHMIAWCHSRQDYRDFKVSRINRIWNTGDAFTKTGHLELNAYIKMMTENQPR